MGPIYPGIGVGRVRLGMRRAAVRTAVRRRSIATKVNPEGDPITEYPGGAYCSFDREEGFRLTHILLEDPGALTLFGEAISERGILAWLGATASVIRDTEYLAADGSNAVEREHLFRKLGFALYVDGTRHVSGCGVFVVFDEQDHVRWPDGNVEPAVKTPAPART